LKHLSTDEKKSTEKPKVVASEIGKDAEFERKKQKNQEEQQDWKKKGNVKKVKTGRMSKPPVQKSCLRSE